MFNPKRTPPKLQHEQSLSEPDLATQPTKDIDMDMNVTSRKRKQPECEHAALLSTMQKDLKSTLSKWKIDLDASLGIIRDDLKTIRCDLETYIMEAKKEIDHLRSENAAIKLQFTEMSQELSEIKTSTQYVSNQYDDYLKRLNSLEERHVDQSGIKALEVKIDNLEQQARQCNLEISNVPERRGENLITILEELGRKIDCTIPRNEIVSIHRVPHAANNDRPKNIVAKLTTRTLRDNILSAYRLKKGLNSSQLGISGTSHFVYVNEHLTLQKKYLLREARAAAKKHNYRFVWVKHATILVKQSETSATIAIRTPDDIRKIRAPIAS